MPLTKVSEPDDGSMAYTSRLPVPTKRNRPLASVVTAPFGAKGDPGSSVRAPEGAMLNPMIPGFCTPAEAYRNVPAGVIVMEKNRSSPLANGVPGTGERAPELLTFCTSRFGADMEPPVITNLPSGSTVLASAKNALGLITNGEPATGDGIPVLGLRAYTATCPTLPKFPVCA